MHFFYESGGMLLTCIEMEAIAICCGAFHISMFTANILWRGSTFAAFFFLFFFSSYGKMYLSKGYKRAARALTDVAMAYGIIAYTCI
jgi:hypothetical protein